MLLLTTPGLSVFAKQTLRLTKGNLKSRYRKTFAGFVWVILNPLIIFGVQSAVFSNVLKVNVPNYFLFLLSGLLPWLFMVQSIEMCTPMLLVSGNLLKAFPVHPLVYLAAQLIDNFINFVVAFTLIFVPLALLDPGPYWRFLLLPLPMITLVIGILGMAWGLATVQVFLRDTRYITTFILHVSFFITPIFYPAHFVPENFRWITAINPFYTLIAPFHSCVHDYDPAIFWPSLLKAAVFSVTILSAAALYWRHKQNELYFNV